MDAFTFILYCAVDADVDDMLNSLISNAKLTWSIGFDVCVNKCSEIPVLQ